MNHAQRIQLIGPGIAGKTWADLGAGSGALTLALLEILGPSGQVYAVDKNLRGLPKHPQITATRADFTRPLRLPPLDGILMANSLHYVRDQASLLEGLKGYLQPGGRVLIVEYQDRRPSPWVPYPVSYEQLSEVATKAGFSVLKIGTQPSDFGGNIYAALLTRA